MLHDFLVNGSAGIECVKAVSQEWAMSFYKAKHGEKVAIRSCQWVA